MKKLFTVIAFLVVATSFSICYGQQKSRTTRTKKIIVQSNEQALTESQQQGSMKSTPAYGELVMRKVEVEADLKQILVDYTEEHPRAKEKKTELDALNKEMYEIAAMDKTMFPKLTSTVGKLILRKIELETELFKLKEQYEDDHPFIKKTKDKLDVLEGEIQKVLQ